MLPDPRRSAAFLLTGLSAMLSAGSTLADLGARALRPSGSDDDRPAPGAAAPGGSPPPRPRPDRTPPAPRAAASPAPSPSPAPPRSVLDEGDTPVVGDGGRARTTESHTEELANQPAAAVIRAVRQASTDDLERLYDYEQAHRARKSVLAAIERALAPPSTP